jgi:uncharacterized membrane protein YhaH (DUF805 family)
MEETKLFAIRMLIAIFVGLCILLPAIYFRAKKLIREGKSVKYLPIKMATAIGLPILSIPILLSNIFWPWKILIIVIAAMGGASWVIGVDATQKALRKIFGLPPIDEHTGKVIEKEDEDNNDERED